MKLFAYGTLRDNMGLVRGWSNGGAVFRVGEVVLKDWKRVVGRPPYFTIEPDPGAEVEGTMYAVDDAMLAAVDRYEGEMYERRTVNVGGADAVVYVMRDRFRQTEEEHRREQEEFEAWVRAMDAAEEAERAEIEHLRELERDLKSDPHPGALDGLESVRRRLGELGEVAG